MNDHDIDTLVAGAAPIRSDEIARLPIDAAAAELRERIVAGGAGRSRSSYGARLVAAAAAVALVVGAVVAYNGRGGSSAYAAEIVEVARAAPRLLITGDGWSVVRADEFSSELGELTFANGDRQLDLHWRTASEHAGYVDDRAHSSEPPSDISVADRHGMLFQHTGTNDYTALWLDGDHSVELRGVAPSEAAFRQVAATIERVDIETWLNAMPESVVKPDDRVGVIAEMLQGIPVPPGWDVRVLNEIEGVSDRYQLGARVAGAVACAWIDLWVEADANGDTAAKSQAALAIGSTKSWPILLEMADEGAYPEILWGYADDITMHDGYNPTAKRDRIRNGEYQDGACIRN